MPVPEEMIEVRSRLDDDTNQPKYGNCALTVGDGSERVEFTNGRALAKRSVVDAYLINNGDLEFPSLGIWRQRGGAPATPAVQSVESDLRGGVVADEETIADAVEQLPIEEKAGLLGKILGQLGVPPEKAAEFAAAALASSDAAAPDDGSGDEPPPSEPPTETDEERKLRETAEEVARLEAEGELDPDADGNPEGAKGVRVVPQGFDERTQEGELRCLAAKGDGSQCQNAAADDGPACHIAAHAKQFAS